MTVNEFNAKHHVGSVIKYQRPGMTDFVMTMTDSEAFTDQHRQAVVRVVMRNAPVRLSELVLEEVTQ